MGCCSKPRVGGNSRKSAFAVDTTNPQLNVKLPPASQKTSIGSSIVGMLKHVVLMGLVVYGFQYFFG
jgi:hypothetical protein